MKSNYLIFLAMTLIIISSCSKGSNSSGNHDKHRRDYDRIDRGYDPSPSKDDYEITDIEYESSRLIISLPDKKIVRFIPVGATLESYISNNFGYFRLSNEDKLEVLGIHTPTAYKEYEATKNRAEWKLYGTNNFYDQIQSNKTYKLIFQKL